MTHIRWYDFGFTLFWLAALVVAALYAGGGEPVVAQVEPMATAAPMEPCKHAATAGSIKIFYCEDIHLFINDLGFMAFEP